NRRRDIPLRTTPHSVAETTRKSAAPPVRSPVFSKKKLVVPMGNRHAPQSAATDPVQESERPLGYSERPLCSSAGTEPPVRRIAAADHRRPRGHHAPRRDPRSSRRGARRVRFRIATKRGGQGTNRGGGGQNRGGQCVVTVV